MAAGNMERLIELIDEVFSVRSDPDQLDVDEKVIERLKKIHPATVSEYDDGTGPSVWILMIPTTGDLMNRFLEKKISEKELYQLTPLHTKYEALYLCSAIALPEYRGRGIAKNLTIRAIESIQKDHPVKTLFVWPFTKQGDMLAEKLALSVGLPLKKRMGEYATLQ
jgi:hypothetical protein